MTSTGPPKWTNLIGFSIDMSERPYLIQVFRCSKRNRYLSNSQHRPAKVINTVKLGGAIRNSLLGFYDFSSNEN